MSGEGPSAFLLCSHVVLVIPKILMGQSTGKLAADLPADPRAACGRGRCGGKPES